MIKKLVAKDAKGFRVFRLKNNHDYSVIIDGGEIVEVAKRHDMCDFEKDREGNECLWAMGSFFTQLGHFCWLCKDLENDEWHIYIDTEEL